MEFAGENLSSEQQATLDAWLSKSGYANAEEWAADSDYHPVCVLNVADDVDPDDCTTHEHDGWVDEDGNPVNPEVQSWWAMRAEREIASAAAAAERTLSILPREDRMLVRDYYRAQRKAGTSRQEARRKANIVVGDLATWAN